MKEIFKNKYNIIIPVFLVIVLCIALLLYGKEYKNSRYASMKMESVYQYFSGSKMEYDLEVGRNKKSAILKLNTDDMKVNLDSTPIYNKSENSVIFPKEMSIVSPIYDSQKLVKSLSEIYTSNKVNYLRYKRYDNNIDNVFLYDGNNLYFLIDATILTIGNKKIELSPMSYVICSYHNFVEYYDKEKDKSEIISLNDENVYLENDYMKLDVGSDKLLFKNSFSLLTKDLSTLAKLEDKSNNK